MRITPNTIIELCNECGRKIFDSELGCVDCESKPITCSICLTSLYPEFDDYYYYKFQKFCFNCFFKQKDREVNFKNEKIYILSEQEIKNMRRSMPTHLLIVETGGPKRSQKHYLWGSAYKIDCWINSIKEDYPNFKSFSVFKFELQNDGINRGYRKRRKKEMKK